MYLVNVCASVSAWRALEKRERDAMTCDLIGLGRKPWKRPHKEKRNCSTCFLSLHDPASFGESPSSSDPIWYPICLKQLPKCTWKKLSCWIGVLNRIRTQGGLKTLDSEINTIFSMSHHPCLMSHDIWKRPCIGFLMKFSSSMHVRLIGSSSLAKFRACQIGS